MKMVKWATLVGLMLGIPSFSHAGIEVGNGGNVLICQNPNGTFKSIELFDYYEGAVSRNLPQQLGAPQLAALEKVEWALSRLARLDFTRANRYREWAKSFYSEASFVHGQVIGGIPDTGPATFPAGCHLEQIAVQRSDLQILPGDKRFVINGDLWDKLDSKNRAGLILHEIIYREAIQYDHKTSLFTRYFNEILSSDTLEGLSPVQYLELIRDQVHFGEAEYHGVNLRLDNKLRYSDDRTCISGGSVKGTHAFIASPDGPVKLTDGEVAFYPDGKIKSAKNVDCEESYWKVHTRFGEYGICGGMDFRPDGSPDTFDAIKGGDWLNGSGFQVRLKASWEYHNGKFKLGRTGLPSDDHGSFLEIDGTQSQVLVSGRPVKVHQIVLDDQGVVQSIQPSDGEKFLILGKEVLLDRATLRPDQSLMRVSFASDFRMAFQETEVVIREAELSPSQDRFVDIELDGRYVCHWKVGWYRTFWGGRKFGRFIYRMQSLQFSPQGEFLSGRLDGYLKEFEYEAAPGVEVDPYANYPCLEFNESGQITGFNRQSCRTGVF